MEHIGPLLVVLDLDETLVHASDQPVPGATPMGEYHVQCRPGLDHCLHTLAQHHRLAVWTSGTDAYGEAIVALVFPGDVREKLEFVWGRSRCTPRFQAENHQWVHTKNLSKLKRRHVHSLRRVVMVDDSPEKLRRHYGNHLPIPPWFGGDDDVLRRLPAALQWLHRQPNVRRVEKRHWLQRF